MEIKHAYETIVIGGGAAGLFFGAAAPSGRDILILEKTKQTGTKLLMSGSGQCNLTHCGSIKEFLLCYGMNGNKIRTCLYRHSNLALCRFMEGPVFPSSNARTARSSRARWTPARYAAPCSMPAHKTA